MAMVCDVYKDAMHFWRHLEDAAEEQLCSSAARKVAALSTCPQHKASCSSKQPAGRKEAVKNTILEFCCDANSTMGKVREDIGIKVVRLHEELL